MVIADVQTFRSNVRVQSFVANVGSFANKNKRADQPCQRDSREAPRCVRVPFSRFYKDETANFGWRFNRLQALFLAPYEDERAIRLGDV